MVAINPATEIPSNINTVEKALLWSAMALQSAIGNSQVTIIANEAPVARAQVQVTKTASGEDIAAITAYVPINFDTLSDPALKPWQAALAIATTTLGTNYKTN